MTMDKMFHGKVFNVLHIEFNMKSKKFLTNRLEVTENILVSFEFLYAHEKVWIQTLILKQAQVSSRFE